ncbi:MAG TPA: agmatine deiminase family protein [Acidobacteriaceae bacterium]|nr:agmatine deiminase family protein [Acidobacteriaceae bacterium]
MNLDQTHGAPGVKKTPRELGLHMPAEWAPHDATWIAWPHNPEDWPGKFHPIPWVYGEIVRQLARVEAVRILVNDSAAEKRARSLLRRCGADLTHVQFHHWLTDRVWLRDSGPIFLTPASSNAPPVPLGVTDWKFNAWAKYQNWQNDDRIPAHVAELLQVPGWQPAIRLADGTEHRVVLEGGSIDVNGAGTLLTTEECLLSEVQQRNLGVSREQLETCFREFLGIEQTIWLDRGIAGDDTHGHVDDIARFVDGETIVAAVETDREDENYHPLQENMDRLRSARSVNGNPYRIVELPLPSPVVFEGQRLPASYANFYIANELVLVPTFNDANDRIALNVLAKLFPGRSIVGIHSGDFIWGLGAMHCMTQQQPAAPGRKP